MTATIIAKDVHKIYKTGKVQVHALRGLSLQINRGEMVAIMGPSGCGKTTLLNCLSGIDDFDEGEILIDGVSLKNMSDRHRTSYRAQEMGFIFQFYNLLPVLTAVENVELPLLVTGVSVKEARNRAAQWLQAVGLGDRLHHKPAELSGGQRQRVTIARALVNDPAIVWADEPTGDLDSVIADEIMASLRKLNQEMQQTLAIVTHDHHIGSMCDYIIHMKDGQVVNIEHTAESTNLAPSLLLGTH